MNYNNEPEMYKKGSVVFRDVSCHKLPAGKYTKLKRTTSTSWWSPAHTMPAPRRTT